MDKLLTEDQKCLLWKIHMRNKTYDETLRISDIATHQNIWRGCYDVWYCEQDQINSVEIPKARMKDALDSGLIFSEKVQYKKWTLEVWHLTDLGKELLEESKVYDN